MSEHVVAAFATGNGAVVAARDLEAAGCPASSSGVIGRKALPPIHLVRGTAETTCTSGGGFWTWLQAWAAVDGIEDKDFARRLRKGTGADATASGATRVAGSLNFKDRYAPNFPRVQITAAQPGRKTTTDELGSGLRTQLVHQISMAVRQTVA